MAKLKINKTEKKTTPSGKSLVSYDLNLLSEEDLHLFNEGTHYRLYQKLGAHVLNQEGRVGTYFAVWAPDAQKVFVIGDFNGWNRQSHPLRPKGSSGIWEGFIPGLGKGSVYKYYIVSRYQGYKVEKADPFAIFSEISPKTASIVWDLDYAWQDQEWMKFRAKRNSLEAPISTYEMHLGSWMRKSEEGNHFLTYREIAPKLADYIQKMGFTHVEFLPIMEHPFYGSLGYQTTGYFAPTRRYGKPQDLMYLVDRLHQNGVGVILDWVPSHFPTDEHGLVYFDGTYLFEHADPKRGYHQEWSSSIFNYGRHEVRSFLLSSAVFWLGEKHICGPRREGGA